MTSRVIALTAGLALVAPIVRLSRRRRSTGCPRLMLWAWERPVDLRGLDRRHRGRVPRADDHRSAPRRHVVSPRRQPLQVDRRTRRSSRSRGSRRRSRRRSDPRRSTEIARGDRAHGRAAACRGVQIDFDARAVAARRCTGSCCTRCGARCTPDTPLSMTALASWCLDDDWLRRSADRRGGADGCSAWVPRRRRCARSLARSSAVAAACRGGDRPVARRAARRPCAAGGASTCSTRRRGPRRPSTPPSDRCSHELATASRRNHPGRGGGFGLRPRVRSVPDGVPQRQTVHPAHPARLPRRARRRRPAALRAALPRPGVSAIHGSAGSRATRRRHAFDRSTLDPARR